MIEASTEPERTETRDRHELQAVLDELLTIRADMLATAAPSSELAAVHANHRCSARNLLHYLALRRHDVRSLQQRLAALGLSSLGRSESHALATIDAVVGILNELLGRPRSTCLPDESSIDFGAGQRLLDEHSRALLGAPAVGRDVRIMVTMPTEAASDYTLVRSLLAQGMDCMRINCAHDAPPTWQMMIENLHRAEHELGRSCRVVMDLAGPKLRTGPIESGPAVLRVRPRRDAYGRVTAPARIWLSTGAAPPTVADAQIRVPAEWLARCERGDQIEFRDARRARRRFDIIDATADGCWAESSKTSYLIPGVLLNRAHSEDSGGAIVGPLAPSVGALRLAVGDQLRLMRNRKPGRPAAYDRVGRVLTPAMIGCTIPEVLDDVRPGEPVWFDDGKIGGVIERMDADAALVRVTHARPGGVTLRADKGINLPESRLQLSALTQDDLDNLAFVAEHADVVEMSFANCAGDVETLQTELGRLGERQPAIVLKIETQRGFENLPSMLLTAMRSPCCGVMIARGDLAVECGFERLAEVQEEILWICEAAHVPVIWATQVLETLAREGMPSRAEITDAAMAHRAECVMLNKGPHMVSAVRVLDDILRRMQAHQIKKQSMLRELRLAHRLPVNL